MFKVGIGYDIHRFALKRKLVLGGVEIPSKQGLLGHSDADVVVHAVCDALLGAMGEGDIGQHFPDKDLKYKNISSLKLLKTVASLLKKKSLYVGNIDVMVLLEAPSISPFKESMKKKIASVLAVSKHQISIKATTNEGLGEIGKKKAAAAYAVVLIKGAPACRQAGRA